VAYGCALNARTRVKWEEEEEEEEEEVQTL
jgi:hypothetical protein